MKFPDFSILSDFVAQFNALDKTDKENRLSLRKQAYRSLRMMYSDAYYYYLGSYDAFEGAFWCWADDTPDGQALCRMFTPDGFPLATGKQVLDGEVWDWLKRAGER